MSYPRSRRLILLSTFCVDTITKFVVINQALNLFHDHTCDAFPFSSNIPRIIKGGSRIGSGDSGGKPPNNRDLFRRGGFDDHNDSNPNFYLELAGVFCMSSAPDDMESSFQRNHNLNIREYEHDNSEEFIINNNLRGGGSTKRQATNILSALSKPISTLRNRASEQSASKQKEDFLSSTTINSVSAPTSEILPLDIIAKFAEESKLINGTLNPETLDRTANHINNWYSKHGYVMNSVTGATLVPDKANDGQGRVELKVREAKLSKSSSSVIIRFVDPCSDEEEGDGVINIPVQHDNRQLESEENERHKKYKITTGRTRPLKLARMVGLTPGSHFRILPHRWSRFVSSPAGLIPGQNSNGGSKSAIFSTIHSVRPIPDGDGDTVTVEIIATENKPYASLEYGVTKSLYSDHWEGELDVKHGNAFGGGEIAALTVRKGRGISSQLNGTDSSIAPHAHSKFGDWNRKLIDGPMSWRMSVKDDSLGGGDAGYDVELFRDQYGLNANENSVDSTGVIDPRRTGAILRLRFPNLNIPRAVSATFERVETIHPGSSPTAPPQSVASVSTTIGPYQIGKTLSHLRSDLSAVFTAGVQRAVECQHGVALDDTRSSDAQYEHMKPYFSGTVTSQQIIPLSPTLLGLKEGSLRRLDVAIRHVASISTRNLPRHDAIMLGLASRVRGYKYHHREGSRLDMEPGPKKRWSSVFQKYTAGSFSPPMAVSNSISGTAEIRMPIEPLSTVVDDSNLKLSPPILSGTLVVFADWAITQGHHDSSSNAGVEIGISGSSSFVQHSSVGVGFRKVVQGMPLKIDACITGHGSRGVFFGIGHDFSA